MPSYFTEALDALYEAELAEDWTWTVATNPPVPIRAFFDQLPPQEVQGVMVASAETSIMVRTEEVPSAKVGDTFTRGEDGTVYKARAVQAINELETKILLTKAS